MCTSRSSATTRSAGSPIRSTRWPRGSSRAATRSRAARRDSGRRSCAPPTSELEAFSYSVSHDLRAPLRAIAGFVQILEEDHAAKLDADARHHLERVKVNARRMGQLIDDLLAFSQIGRAPMQRQNGRSHGDGERRSRTTRSRPRAAPSSCRSRRCRRATASRRSSTRCSSTSISNAVKFTAKVPNADDHDRLDDQRRDRLLRSRQRRRLRRTLRGKTLRRVPAPASQRASSRAPASASRSSTASSPATAAASGPKAS